LAEQIVLHDVLVSVDRTSAENLSDDAITSLLTCQTDSEVHPPFSHHHRNARPPNFLRSTTLAFMRVFFAFAASFAPDLHVHPITMAF
jgi:hypothetical protein